MDVVKQGPLLRLDAVKKMWVEVWCVLDTTSLCCFNCSKDDARMIFPPLLFRNCKRVLPSVTAVMAMSSSHTDPVSFLNGQQNSQGESQRNFHFALESLSNGEINFFSCGQSAKHWLQWTKALSTIPLLQKPHQLGKHDSRIPDDALQVFLGAVRTSQQIRRSLSPRVSKPRTSGGGVQSFRSTSPYPLTGRLSRDSLHGANYDREHSNTTTSVSFTRKDTSTSMSQPRLSNSLLQQQHHNNDARIEQRLQLVHNAQGHVLDLKMNVVDLEVSLAAQLEEIREKESELTQLGKDYDALRIEAYRAKQDNKQYSQNTENFVEEEISEMVAVLKEESNRQLSELKSKWEQRRKRYEQDIEQLKLELNS